MKIAVIILFHGSRAEGSERTAKRIVSDVRKRGGYEIVTEAYLQHGSPGISQAVEQCIEKKAREIVIVPYFTQSGAHVTRDIPAFTRSVGKKHPGIKITVADFVGSHPLITDIVTDLVKKRRVNAKRRVPRVERFCPARSLIILQYRFPA